MSTRQAMAASEVANSQLYGAKNSSYDEEFSLSSYNNYKSVDDLENALKMINKLSGICATFANISSDTITDATDFLNDPKLFDFFVQRVEAGIEIEKLKRTEKLRESELTREKEKLNGKLSPETCSLIANVQQQISALKTTLHRDHTQLLQAVLPDSDTFSSD